MDPFQQAVQGLRNVQPTGVDSKFPDIANLFNAQRESRVKGALTSALGSAASTSLRQKEAEADYSRRNAISALQEKKQSIESKLSGEGYTRQINPSGGYTFFDPDGNTVTAHDYSRATSKPLPTVLSGSLDPKQKSFVDDYENAIGFGEIVMKYAQLPSDLKSEKKIKELEKKRTTIEKTKKGNLTPEERTVLDYVDNSRNYPDIIGKKPQDLITSIISSYPEIFREGQFQSPVQGESAGGDLPGRLSVQPQPQQGGFQNFINMLRGR